MPDERSARRVPAGDDDPTASTADDGWLLAGIVGRPHGLDGSVHVAQPRVALLDEGRELRVNGRADRVVRRAGTDSRPIIRLASCSSRNDAELLRGRELFVSRREAPPLEEDEWWPEELEGCRVVDGDREVGVVRALRALPSCEVLEVVRDRAGDLLVPLIRDAVRTVDVDARVVDVDLAFLGEDADPVDAPPRRSRPRRARPKRARRARGPASDDAPAQPGG
jgi:16S rRNA processing protein RimM